MRQGGNELGPHDGLNPRGGKDAVVILLLKTGYSICNLDYVVENYKVPYWNETTYERLRFANDKGEKADLHGLELCPFFWKKPWLGG